MVVGKQQQTTIAKRAGTKLWPVPINPSDSTGCVIATSCRILPTVPSLSQPTRYSRSVLVLGHLLVNYFGAAKKCLPLSLTVNWLVSYRLSFLVRT
ncbi:hypothetical protein D3C73_1468430 [compost metagenome]